ncbi:MAG: MBL fold metallo-hydrolase [Pigmentiphaga sp.]|uniref:MBL fold metallo-hydrolase n=1 Tax=Pigmentiphaga sp. TaxID=1977564 RepID=UPI003B544D53
MKILWMMAAAMVTAAVPPAVLAADVAPAAAFVTLGTGGGPVIRRERAEPANAVVVGDSVYLFDVGAGTERQMVAAGLSMHKVKAVFVSHHHIDHNADLGQILASRWMFNSYQPLPVIGPPGTARMVADLVAAARTVELAPIGGGPGGKPPLASTVKAADLDAEMDEPAEIYRDANLRVLAVTNTHYHFPPGSPQAAFSRSYAFRIETPGRVYVFTGDTGPSKNVERLARGADVLVSEVINLDSMVGILKRAPDLKPAMLPSMIRHMEQNHLTPVEIGKLAAAAGVKEVVLTHLAPGEDGERDLSGYVRGIQPAFMGPVRIASDLQRF